MRSSKSKTQKSKPKFKKSDLSGWLIMLPSLILFAFFVWEPLIENIRLSLYSATRFELEEFVGLENYIKVFNSPDFAAAFKNTFSYTFWSLLIGYFVPIILGILISETVHFRGIFRVGVYFPNIIPGLATIWIWSYFFTPGKTGVLNILLGKIGIEPFEWLNNPHWTIPLIIVTMTWKAAGSTALIYMASISNIDPDLYEAATIDGAGIFQRIRHVTIPSIKPLAKTLLIMQIISVFQIIYEPMVMKNGGPNNASISLLMLMYRYGFRDFDFPAAAALSVIVSLILIMLSGVYFKATAKKDD